MPLYYQLCLCKGIILHHKLYKRIQPSPPSPVDRAESDHAQVLRRPVPGPRGHRRRLWAGAGGHGQAQGGLRAGRRTVPLRPVSQIIFLYYHLEFQIHSLVWGDVQMTSALRGREGVSQILTKGRKVA